VNVGTYGNLSQSISGVILLSSTQHPQLISWAHHTDGVGRGGARREDWQPPPGACTVTDCVHWSCAAGVSRNGRGNRCGLIATSCRPPPPAPYCDRWDVGAAIGVDKRRGLAPVLPARRQRCKAGSQQPSHAVAGAGHVPNSAAIRQRGPGGRRPVVRAALPPHPALTSTRGLS
jgi:hypothetical protein